MEGITIWTPQITQSNRLNLEEEMEYFFRIDNYKEETQRSYRVGVLNFKEYLEANNIELVNEEVLSGYRTYLGENFSVRTANLYLTGVRWLFRHLIPRGIPNLMANIHNFRIKANFSKLPIPIRTYLDMEATIEEERESLKDYRDYAILKLSVLCMLREIEISRADKTDIQLLDEVNILKIQGKGSDSKDAIAVLVYEVLIAIYEYLELRGEDDFEPLFISLSNNQYGHRLTTRAIRQVLREYLDRFGLKAPYYTGHSTRHTGATALAKSGMATIQEIQEVLRHKDIKTTTIYTKLRNRLERPMEGVLQDYFRKERELKENVKESNY